MYDAKGLIHDMIGYYSKKGSNNKTENKHARQLTEWMCSTCMFVKLFKHTPMKNVHYVLRILGKEKWFFFFYLDVNTEIKNHNCPEMRTVFMLITFVFIYAKHMYSFHEGETVLKNPHEPQSFTSSMQFDMLYCTHK